MRKNTIQVAEDISESSYGFVAAPEVRSVARMLTHVAIATRIWEEIHKERLTTLVGFDYFGVMYRFNAEEAKPRSKAEIRDFARRREQFAAWMETAKLPRPALSAFSARKSTRCIIAPSCRL